MQYGDGQIVPQATENLGMLKKMREGSAYFIKGVMLVVAITFIGTIFVVWGVKSTPGDLARRGVVATVAGTDITVEDYQLALRQQIQAYRQIFGNKLDEKLLESLNLKQQVVEQLIRRRLVLQYAERIGVTVSTEELADEIRRMPAFGGKESFNRQRYLDILKANRLTPERFEADIRRAMTEWKMEALIRGAVKVSEAEAREAFRQIHRQVTVEVVNLPPGEEGRKLADKVTLALGQGRSFAEAGRGAGAPVKSFGPFPLDAPPKEVPDPEAFRQAVSLLRPGEVSPLVTGQKASYLIQLVRQQDPAQAEFEKEKETFRARMLLQKRTTVFSDWLSQLRQAAKVSVDQESL
jgi:parvulin-like peptidyl-prolyl isomerase